MKKSKPITFIGTALAIFMAFTGCSDETDNNTGSVIYYDNSENSYVNPNDIEKIARENSSSLTGVIGETSTIGAFDINIKNILSVVEREGAYYNGKVEVIAIEIELKNNSSDTLGTSGLGDFLINIDESYESDSMQVQSILALKDKVDNFSTLDSELETGQSVSGYLAFEAPKDWKNITLTYKPQSKELSYDQISFDITPEAVK